MYSFVVNNMIRNSHKYLSNTSGRQPINESAFSTWEQMISFAVTSLKCSILSLGTAYSLQNCHIEESRLVKLQLWEMGIGFEVTLLISQTLVKWKYYYSYI